MTSLKVAGTVMLNSTDGVKKFLVEKIRPGYKFVTAEISNERTGLACILEALKNDAKIDVSKIGLVELANAHVMDGSIPLFVFEMDEESVGEELQEDLFVWETPATLREVLENYEINGVPSFQ